MWINTVKFPKLFYIAKKKAKFFYFFLSYYQLVPSGAVTDVFYRHA